MPESRRSRRPNISIMSNLKTLKILTDFLNHKNIHYKADPENNSIWTRVVSNFASHDMEFVINENNDFISLYIDLGFSISEDKRPVTAEFIAYGNAIYPVGNFTLNMYNGEVYYRITQLIRNTKLKTDILEDMIDAGIYCINTNFNGFTAIQNDGKTAAEAFSIVEENFDTENPE